jgi:WD40 repeat protein
MAFDEVEKRHMAPQTAISSEQAADSKEAEPQLQKTLARASELDVTVTTLLPAEEPLPELPEVDFSEPATEIAVSASKVEVIATASSASAADESEEKGPTTTGLLPLEPVNLVVQSDNQLLPDVIEAEPEQPEPVSEALKPVISLARPDIAELQSDNQLLPDVIEAESEQPGPASEELKSAVSVTPPGVTEHLAWPDPITPLASQHMSVQQAVPIEPAEQQRQVTQNVPEPSPVVSAPTVMSLLKIGLRFYIVVVVLLIIVAGIWQFATKGLPSTVLGLVIGAGVVAVFLMRQKDFIAKLLPPDLGNQVKRLPIWMRLILVIISFLTVGGPLWATGQLPSPNLTPIPFWEIFTGVSALASPTVPISPTATPSPGKLMYSPRLYPGFSVDSVAVSADGQYLVSANGDNTVQVFDVMHHLLVSTFRNTACHIKTCWFNDAAFSPVSNPLRVAAASTDGSICVFDAKDGSNLNMYHVHTRSVLVVAWSPNGRYIVSGGMDNKVQVIDASTGKIIRTFQKHQGYVWSVAWSMDGNLIASGDDTGTVLIWNPENGQILSTISGHAGPVYEIAWAPIGSQRIVTASGDGKARIWDVLSGKLLGSHLHTGSVQTAQWSPDAQLIASGGKDNTVEIWRAATGELIYTYHGHVNTVWSVAWLPGGALIASTSQDGSMQVWQTGQND